MPLTKKNLFTMLETVLLEAWRSVTIDGTVHERKWLLVLEHASDGGARHRFGLLDDGSWSALYADGARVCRPEVRVPFLPLLEHSWTVVAADVISAVRALGLPPILATTFPLDE